MMVLVLMIGCLSETSRMCSSVIHYTQNADSQHLITFPEMFLSLRVGSRQKGKYDDLALSD
jgi:hypothetical protein